ncbi:MAG: peptidyl-prolyl cis-trans isomerase [Polyangiaceae bacterium]|nr:peptidyl-prolyl cis-trans isomerase [Polyangiaceae bacterium]MCW5790764.1 peptidyl-prolyl cis-trans isomerase [Polyangiaceae bacterium]
MQAILKRRAEIEAQRAAGPTISASHILIPFKGAERSTAERSKEEAKTLAEKIAKQAQAPGADFAALAKEHSADSSAERGGDLGSFGQGRMVKPFADAAFALEVGQVSQVVESQFGFHIIKRTK